MNEKISKIKLELLKEEFIKQIKDSYTLNLSMVLLEEFENLQQENNCFFQCGRGSGKTYIMKLEQQLNLYKEIIEEVKKNLKLERKLALSLNQPYTISIVDRTLHILDKAKGEINNE